MIIMQNCTFGKKQFENFQFCYACGRATTHMLKLRARKNQYKYLHVIYVIEKLKFDGEYYIYYC